ncbi:hypothetical protein INT48_007455, partial [Thamnidium elegans]
MFFYVKYSDENVKKYKKKIEDFEEADICYNVDEHKPISASKLSIFGDPFTYKTYLEAESSKTDSQMKRFINEVYCCEELKNAEIYCKLSVSTKNIYDTIMQYSTIFERRTAQSFANWCRNNRIKFLNKKSNVIKGTRVRELYIMEEIYYDNLICSISKYLPNYQESVRNLIHEGYEIVGYARKSPGDEDENDRIRLLQDMINNLSERSFAQRIYVSPNSCASTPFFERDLKLNDNIMDKLENIRGNSQDMLEYLGSVDHDICLISIDFAGLTSRANDIIQLIEDNPSIKKIAIDTFTISDEVFLFDADSLKMDDKLLEYFN